MIVENVATLVDPPTVDETEANPFTMEEAKAFLLAAANRPTCVPALKSRAPEGLRSPREHCPERKGGGLAFTRPKAQGTAAPSPSPPPSSPISETTRSSRPSTGGGTIPYELRVDMPPIVEILRHTQISRTRRCVKGRSALSKDAMLRMGNAFAPKQPTGPSETGSETSGRRTERSRRRCRIQ